MIEDVCKWLPRKITLSEFKGNWEKYNLELYEIFKNDFIDNSLFFQKLKVQIRVNPKENNFEHAFIHLTCISKEEKKDINDRIPDMARCERIAWNRKIIENYQCKHNCQDCQKILYYEEYYHNHIRIYLVFADVRFKVILEKRERYILLITGYYIQFDWVLNRDIKRANMFKTQKTPLV